MPFWYGPQTHQEAPGSSIAIQHEIKRQSPWARGDELCTGAIRSPRPGSCPSPSPCAHTHCLSPSGEGSHRGIPQPKPSSEVGAFPLLCLGQWKMLHQVYKAIEHSISDPYGPWEHTSLVMCSIQKTEDTKEQKTTDMPIMNMHCHDTAFGVGSRNHLF